jgi:hypothetical protein
MHRRRDLPFALSQDFLHLRQEAEIDLEPRQPPLFGERA